MSDSIWLDEELVAAAAVALAVVVDVVSFDIVDVVVVVLQLCHNTTVLRNSNCHCVVVTPLSFNLEPISNTSERVFKL